MPAGACMLAGVAVGGAVAAQRSSTLLAGTQMDPLRPDLYALGALPPLGLPHGGDRFEVRAGTAGHRRPLLTRAALGAPQRWRSIPRPQRRPRASSSRRGR